MTRKLVTLSPEASVAEALTLCRERRIRHIPILEEGRLVGIVSDRDLRDASPALGEPERARTLQEIRRSEEHTSELQSRQYLVCRLLLEKKTTRIIPLKIFRDSFLKSRMSM